MKNTLESVRYHLKKTGNNASNAVISSYLSSHPELSPRDIADLIAADLASETTAIATPAAPSVTPAPSATPAATPAPLTVLEKQDLTTAIANQEFSISLSAQDVSEIVNALNPAIADELEFLAQVKTAIAVWLEDRRNKTATAINKELADIANLINQDNANLSSLFDTTNQQLKSLVSAQKTRHTDFKSRNRADVLAMLKLA